MHSESKENKCYASKTIFRYNVMTMGDQRWKHHCRHYCYTTDIQRHTWSAVHHVWSSALELMSSDELGHISFLCATVTMKQFVIPDDYSDCHSLRIPDCTEKGSESF